VKFTGRSDIYRGDTESAKKPMLDFSTLEWLIVIGCAISIGFNKTSGIGVAILFVPLVASIMPARLSVGFILPMLCMSDVIALSYWWRQVRWPLLAQLLPWALVGITLGFFCLSRIDDKLLMTVIAAIILVMIALTTWRNSRFNSPLSIPTRWWFAAFMGILTGTASTLANSAGPIMVIYLLSLRLDKKAFVSTHLGCFWILNLIKVPLYLHLDLINLPSFLTDLALLPALAAGALLGIALVHRINQKTFNVIVSIMTVLAALYLIFKALS
jgi:uncharacterized membrane protein YfcA